MRETLRRFGFGIRDGDPILFESLKCIIHSNNLNFDCKCITVRTLVASHIFMLPR